MNHSDVSVEPLPDVAQHAVQRQRRIGERVLGMAIGEVVGEVRIVGHLDAWQVLVDDEQRRLALQAVDRPGQHQEVAGDVAVGDEPLLAREPVHVAVAHRLGADRPRVGAGVLLRDRVGVPMLAANVGQQVALDLVGSAVDEHVGRAPHQHPQTVGQPAQLLVHDDLLGQVEAAAAVLGGDVGRVQAGVEHRLLDPGVRLRRQPSVALLGLELERLEHVVDERSDACTKLQQLGREREIHRFDLSVRRGEPRRRRRRRSAPPAGLPRRRRPERRVERSTASSPERRVQTERSGRRCRPPISSR